jgi:signal peptidase I
MTSHRAEGRRRSSLRALFGHLLLGTLASAAAVIFLVLAVGPHLLGYRTLTMLSGSMRPSASPGDLLIVRPEPTAAVHAGQVLSFTAPLPGAPVVSHRVVSVERDQSGTVIRTQGDANMAEDPWRLRLSGDTAWHLVAVVPAGGRLVAALHRPSVWLVTVWLLPLWICLDTIGLSQQRLRPLFTRLKRGKQPERHWLLRTFRRTQLRRFLLTLPCAIIFTLILPSTTAVAGFTRAPSAPSATYATATLQPASAPGGSCLRGGGSTATATVTWTASPSAFTTGYTIAWTGGSTGNTTAASSPLTVPGLNKNSDYVFTITATYRNWTSTTQTTPTISC